MLKLLVALSLIICYCNSRKKEETFFSEYGPLPKYFYIESLDSRYVLELENSDPCAGARVILAEKVPGKQSQIWSYEGLSHIKNNYSGFYLDMKGGRTPGSELIVWPKNDGLNQKWTYQPPHSTFMNGLEFVMDVQNARKVPGTPVVGFPFHGGTNQKFIKTPVAMSGPEVEIQYPRTAPGKFQHLIKH